MLMHLAGGDDNVAIIVGKYASAGTSIQCAGTKRLSGGCRDLMGGVVVAPQHLRFAPEGKEADVELPAVTQSCEFFFSSRNILASESLF